MSATLDPQVEYFQNENGKFWSGCEYAIRDSESCLGLCDLIGSDRCSESQGTAMVSPKISKAINLSDGHLFSIARSAYGNIQNVVPATTGNQDAALVAIAF